MQPKFNCMQKNILRNKKSLCPFIKNTVQKYKKTFKAKMRSLNRSQSVNFNRCFLYTFHKAFFNNYILDVDIGIFQW